jgi:actin-like ATPase involved in cell morphogenesis
MYRIRSRKQKPDIAIDLGTANTRIMTTAEGIDFDEPTLCCFSGDTGRNQLVAAGMDAGETIAWPDRSATERMLRIVGVTPPDDPIASPD